ncbi:hypothetical protein GCM10025874_03190 [Arenivirga flava]|uniref:Uncharacterized protein n=1 Tax=Arenivirga flava TaxID=1930060 RepID=A0AA37UL58_9MICO|nr:hypothetical protein GCM10025874_03190 [Arenivirga flava]
MLRCAGPSLQRDAGAPAFLAPGAVHPLVSVAREFRRRIRSWSGTQVTRVAEVVGAPNRGDRGGEGPAFLAFACLASAGRSRMRSPSPGPSAPRREPLLSGAAPVTSRSCLEPLLLGTQEESGCAAAGSWVPGTRTARRLHSSQAGRVGWGAGAPSACGG